MNAHVKYIGRLVTNLRGDAPYIAAELRDVLRSGLEVARGAAMRTEMDELRDAIVEHRARHGLEDFDGREHLYMQWYALKARLAA